MSNVWFIRHAECIANVGEATKTADEAQLTSKGWQEADCVADYLLNTSRGELTRIISSHYRRALQTARPTRNYFERAIFETELPVHEFDYLALSSNVSTTSADRSPLVKKFWQQCSPIYRHEKKAESFRDFIGRVESVLNKLQGYEEDQLIVVFSHHQFIQAVRWLLQSGKEIRASNLGPGEMNDFHEYINDSPIPNGAILKTTIRRGVCEVLPHIEISHLPDNTLLACYKR
jgi:broad specificity phosphatase PhoE